jgi:hypothetical protein
MMPLSFNGFGFAAILVMVAILSAAEGIKFLRQKFHR